MTIGATKAHERYCAMGRQFEELDYRETPLGALSLRRRHEPLVGEDVYEVKLDDDFLMSSLFTASETALADLGIANLADSDCDIVVGGLGLGYTASAVLHHKSVRSLLVVDLLPAVIECNTVTVRHKTRWDKMIIARSFGGINIKRLETAGGLRFLH